MFTYFYLFCRSCTSKFTKYKLQKEKEKEKKTKNKKIKQTHIQTTKKIVWKYGETENFRKFNALRKNFTSYY